MEFVKSLIEQHKMTPHPEGGHYIEVFKNKMIYLLGSINLVIWGYLFILLLQTL